MKILIILFFLLSTAAYALDYSVTVVLKDKKFSFIVDSVVAEQFVNYDFVGPLNFPLPHDNGDNPGQAWDQDLKIGVFVAAAKIERIEIMPADKGKSRSKGFLNRVIRKP